MVAVMLTASNPWEPSKVHKQGKIKSRLGFQSLEPPRCNHGAFSCTPLTGVWSYLCVAVTKALSSESQPKCWAGTCPFFLLFQFSDNFGIPRNPPIRGTGLEFHRVWSLHQRQHVRCHLAGVDPSGEEGRGKERSFQGEKRA